MFKDYFGNLAQQEPIPTVQQIQQKAPHKTRPTTQTIGSIPQQQQPAPPHAHGSQQ